MVAVGWRVFKAGPGGAGQLGTVAHVYSGANQVMVSWDTGGQGIEPEAGLTLGKPAEGGTDVIGSEDGRDLRDVGGGMGLAPPGGLHSGLPVAYGGVMSLTALLRLVPGGVRMAVAAAIRLLGRVGDRVGWSRLPGWVQSSLVAVGVTVGTTILVDIDDAADGAGILAPVEPGGAMQPFVSGAVVGSWMANGVKFYRLWDGRLAVQNKLGRWKVWKPKRPIVIYGSGAKDIPTFLRADAALNRQSKRLRKALDRRAPRAKKTTKAVMPMQKGPDGTFILQNS